MSINAFIYVLICIISTAYVHVHIYYNYNFSNMYTFNVWLIENCTCKIIFND